MSTVVLPQVPNFIYRTSYVSKVTRVERALVILEAGLTFSESVIITINSSDHEGEQRAQWFFKRSN